MKKILLQLLTLAMVFDAHGMTFHKTEETLNKIMDIISRKEKGAYFRFGDGDVYLANGIDDSLQPKDDALQAEMQEAFGLNGPNILKCLPLGCKEIGYEEGMCINNHENVYEESLKYISMASPFWNGPMEDVYSMSALAFAATHKLKFCLKFLKFLRQSNCVLFIGNERVPQHIRKLLFGPECEFVATPSIHSYYQIDRIEKEALEKLQGKKGYKVIITAMGCSGRPLQKRLWNQLDDVFLFDFGSLLDAICGWNTRAWIGITHDSFDHGKFLRTLKLEMAKVTRFNSITRDQFPSDFEFLDKIAYEGGTDKGSNGHKYTEVYADFFGPLRDKPFKFLEIGIADGGSVRVWEKYLPKAELHFIDINDSSYRTPNAQYHFLDQADRGALDSFAKKVDGNFDIIIDDGGHRMDQQIISLETLFPYLKSGGTYIIEDLHTSYWKSYGGNGDYSNPIAGPGTAVEYLKNLVEDVNYTGAATGYADWGKATPEMREKLTEFQKSILSIQFFKSMCFIRKR